MCPAIFWLRALIQRKKFVKFWIYIHMASTATFAGPCSFHKIFHYIFAHLGLYFVDNGANLFFEYLNWLRSISINPTFHVTSKKNSRGVKVIVAPKICLWKKKFFYDFKTGNYIISRVICKERLFLIKKKFKNYEK